MKKKNRFKFKTLLKLIVIAVFLTSAVGAGSYFLYNRNKPINALTNKAFGWKFPVAKFPTAGPVDGELAYSTIRDPGGIPQGLPVRLKIPSIGVDSAIEDALITPDGRMDVPIGSVNVAWFSLGPHPGKEGSSVIGGHFGINNGKKFVFYDLDKLKGGDKVYIVNDKGETLAFQVRTVSLFDRDADATTVFTSGDGKAHLNLITCEGVWNRVNDSYPQRRVVFTDSIGIESPPAAAAVKTPAPVAVKPILPTTAKSTAKPTPLATAGPTSQPSISPTAAPEAAIPTPPSENKSPVPPQVLVAARSLYATPTDGIVTSILIVSILFVAFRIIRR